MQIRNHHLLLTALLLLCAWPLQAEVVKTEQIEVELLAETTGVVPGETLWLAVRLDPIEHWHTYWQYGGDSGEATAASQWQLPEGASAGDILWPVPRWTPFPGTDLVTFDYPYEVFLPIPVSVPADYSAPTFDLRTKIDWQVCDEICIPGDAEFSLSLPVTDRATADPRWADAFAATRASLPQTDHDLKARFNTHDGKINLLVAAPDTAFSGVTEAYFFPLQDRVFKFAPYRKVFIEDNRLQVSLEQHRRMPQDLGELSGVLAVQTEEGEWQGYALNLDKTQVAWQERVEVELLSEASQLAPGTESWFALRLKANPDWHTYWKMGGDSGEATETTDWQAPEGTQISQIRWPAPYWLPFQGSDLVNYGYEDEVVLPFTVQIPADYSGSTVEFSTTVKWYVCELICIPGEQRLDLTLPTGPAVELDIDHAALLQDALAKAPQRDHDLQFIIAAAGERVSLGFQAPTPEFADIVDAWFFPDQRRVIANGPLRDVTILPNLIQITHEQPRRMLTDLSAIYGTLVVANAAGERRAYEFLNPAEDANQVTITPMAATTDASAGDNGPGGSSLLVILGYVAAALVGGIILNLMPCVFPVLSLKALAFAANAGASRNKQRMDGLVYTAGVISTFLVLASILIALRAGGEMVGWAFQLQAPWFVALLIFLFFAMGLSLSGVFEIGTSLMNAGSDLTEHSHGYRRSFFTGALATVVASPCTAPFMGPALGFALAQTWAVAMLVFAALGLGMALPILLLSFVPVLAKFMPRPGKWMETFKEFMAFPLYITALWLLWVLGNQVGVSGMAAVLGACIALAFAVWLFRQGRGAKPFWRFTGRGVAIICLLGILALLRTPLLVPLAVNADVSYNADGSINQRFEPFSTARLNELRAAGKPVFVNMTATWCITCLANEGTTLGTESVQQAMLANGVTYLKGDWTNQDPEITQVLNEFNRPSVPLYILYPGDPQEEPVILPQILTPRLMIDAMGKL